MKKKPTTKSPKSPEVAAPEVAAPEVATPEVAAAPVTNDAARIEDAAPEKPVYPQPERPDYGNTVSAIRDAYSDSFGVHCENIAALREAARKAAAIDPAATAEDISRAISAAEAEAVNEVTRANGGVSERVARVVPCSPADKEKAKEQFRANPGHVATLFHSLPREIASLKVQYSGMGKPVARRIRCDAKKLRSFAEQQPGSVATAILFEALTLATRTGRFLAGIDPAHMHSFTLTLKGDKPTCAPSRDAYVPFPE